METQAGKFPHLLAWIAAIALIVLCGTGVAAIMGWIPTSMGKPDEAVLTTKQDIQAPSRVAEAPVPAAVVAATCAGCGVVHSVHRAKAKRVKSTKRYEVTVHFDDGTSQVITEASMPSWQSGDRVKVVNGIIQSNA